MKGGAESPRLGMNGLPGTGPAKAARNYGKQLQNGTTSSVDNKSLTNIWS
jgi:hypothetical protein